ncbi:MAG: methyltransferase domain-containing protein [Ktedonobacteraceae bacterium]
MPSVTKIHTTGVITQSSEKSAKTSLIYTNKYYGTLQPRNWKAVLRIVPKVLEMIQPTSVIDVGCGTGTFLAAFREHSIEDILGIDGAYIQRNLLVIPQESFISRDLNKPFTLDRTFDLVVCLEVAEHLSPRSADDFIASLTSLGSIILFSAAIPYQGGTSHLNEQWPEYWADLFKQHGFVPVDALRRGIWHDREVPFWYRQNMLFFCTEEALASNEKLAEAYKITDPAGLSMVHPELYLECNSKYVVILRHILVYLEPLWLIKQKMRRRVGKWKNSVRRSV